MKRTLLALALAAVAVPQFAQTNADKLVARVNGREMTNRDVDTLWSRIPEKMQQDYLKSGGKLSFLQNYIAKRLLIEDAVKSGFAKKIGAPAELDSKAESVLFDRYVREVVAAPIVTEERMRQVYEEKREEFIAPEQGRLRIIRALKKDRPELARETMEKVMIEIFTARTQLAQTYGSQHLGAALAAKFSEVARRVSDDPSAEAGGDLGWVAVNTLDPKIAAAVRTIKPGTISGILDTREAYQMVLVEEHLHAGLQPFDSVKAAVREYVLALEQKKVMDAVAKKSAEARAAGKVEIFAENLR